MLISKLLLQVLPSLTWPYLSLDWPGLEWIYLFPCSSTLIDDCDVLSVMRQVKYSPQQYLGAAVVATGIAIVLLPHLRYPLYTSCSTAREGFDRVVAGLLPSCAS
jgi:hypothetical protein